MIFIPVLSWREGADDQKAKNELYRAKIEILNTAFAREVPLIQAIAGWGWPLTSEASLEYRRNAAR